MQIREHTVKGIDLVDVLDAQDQLLLRVAPGFGAKVMELNLPVKGNIEPILWKVNFEELHTNEFGKNDILFPFPNRVEDGQYEYQGNRYDFPINEKEYNNSIHGFVREREFHLKQQESGSNEVRITFEYQYKGELYYPFPFHLEVGYTLRPGVFQISFTITNIGNTTFPYGLGWHPYFVQEESGDTKVQLPDSTEHMAGERYLPIGKVSTWNKRMFRPGDSLYNVTLELEDSSPSYVFCSGRRGVRIIPSADFGFLQIYTPPQKNVIALEPMTCGINAFNTGIGLRELGAGDSFDAYVAINLV
ncbi:MAG: hypothetical protein AAFX53_00145 [Bacteroidota bacterium]